MPLLTALCFLTPPEACYYSLAIKAWYTLLLNYISPVWVMSPVARLVKPYLTASICLPALKRPAKDVLSLYSVYFVIAISCTLQSFFCRIKNKVEKPSTVLPRLYCLVVVSMFMHQGCSWFVVLITATTSSTCQLTTSFPQTDVCFNSVLSDISDPLIRHPFILLCVWRWYQVILYSQEFWYFQWLTKRATLSGILRPLI